jgi:hypothetical protein
VWFVAGVDPCGWFVEAFRTECAAAALKTMHRLSEASRYRASESGAGGTLINFDNNPKHRTIWAHFFPAIDFKLA